mmetsp:Transcript_12093/g.35944  ORF Transcript_12093/g.35944 Transcript_12093/m.35944 type:complete len:125 (+) Transcript_12093:274-648(+)
MSFFKKKTEADDSESEDEDFEGIVDDDDEGSEAEEDELDRADKTLKRDRKREREAESSDSSDSDSDDAEEAPWSKEEMAPMDPKNIIPRAKRRAALASGIGDKARIEEIKAAKPDSDSEQEFEF